MERLAKALARAGIASRRKAEQLIFEGRVQVNGHQILLPQHLVDINQDVILVDKKRVTTSQVRYFILNKPKGYICSAAENIKKRAIDLIPVPSGIRLFTVGRLDKDTEGLLLLTNDGHLAHRLMHPSFETEKEYLAKVDRELLPTHLETIAKGCRIEGAHVRPKRVQKVRRGTLRITLVDGKKHEARELLHHAECEVVSLKRIRIGSLTLGSLPTGSWRELKKEEVDNLFGRVSSKKEKKVCCTDSSICSAKPHPNHSKHISP